MSPSPCASAIEPRSSTWSGNARPDPRSSVIAPLPEVDHGSADSHTGRVERDRCGSALELERRRALDRDLSVALDRDVLAFDVDVPRRLQRGRAARLVLPILLVLLLHVVADLDEQLAVALDRVVLLRLRVDLRVALQRERARHVTDEVVAGEVLAVEERAQHVRPAR